MKINYKNFETLCQHAGHVTEPTRAHLTPIYASSTYLFDTTQQAIDIFQGKENGYIYGRFGNPTITEVENKIAALEAFQLKNNDGNNLELKAILHSSGMAAISTLMFCTLKAGDTILTHLSLYGGTQELLDKVLPHCGIHIKLIDFTNIAAVAQEAATNTYAMMYIETPANPTLQCVDIEALSAIAKANNMLVACDNTFATPYLQQPFKYNVDFVIHSTTKYLNGHGTAIGGILIGKDLEFMRTKATKHHRLLGANSNAYEAFLLNNGIKTLPLRMKQHCDNAKIIADYLSNHSKVQNVNYLGQTNHPHHAIAAKQMKDFGGMLSFECIGELEGGKKFIDNLQLCINAVSLGTTDTLVCHSASTTHLGVAPHLRRASGITDGLIRMSVGIENAEDIIEDIEQALTAI